MFDLLKRLSALLRPENVVAIDNLLTVILTPQTKAFEGLWLAFRQRVKDTNGAAYETAYRALSELHEIVKAYRMEKKV